VSGEKFAFGDRPGGRRVMDLCRHGGVDLVAVKHTDRFGRTTVDALLAQRELKAAGAHIVSVNEGIDTRRGDQLNLELRLVLAGEENRRRTERSIAGQRARAKESYWPGGPPPFGFALSEPLGAGRQRLVIDDHEAAVLRKAASLIVDDRLSTYAAAQALNGLALPPRVGDRWVHQNLRRVLKAPTLGGRYVYESAREHGGPIEMEIPAVLPPDRHAALLAALDAAALGPKDPAGSRYYLLSRGRLTGDCGASYHGIWRRDRASRAYRCNNRRPDAVDRCDDQPINADLVEQVVWAEVAALLSEPERLMQMAEEALGLHAHEADDQEDQIVVVERKLAELEQVRVQGVVQAMKAGLDAATMKAATGELDAEIGALAAHRDRLVAWRERTEADTDRAQRLHQLAAGARERLATMAPVERRQVLDLLDVRVTVTGWKPCEACGGRGKLKGGRGGLSCPACRAMRRTPLLRVEGVVLDTLSVVELTDGVRRPSTC